MTPPDALATPPPRSLPAGPGPGGGTGTPPGSRHAPRPGPAATVRKYLKILRASLVERMAYRGDFLFGTILRFLPLLTTILLWEAVYRGAKQKQLAGFNFREMIAYLLLTNISRMFSSM